MRQVHLVHEELLEELSKQGFQVEPGSIGETITTRGVDLLGLPHGARLLISDEAVVEITGLRNPCKQLDDHQPGLLKAVLDRDENGALVRKAGIMGVVITGGIVKAGDEIDVLLPDPPFAKLDTV